MLSTAATPEFREDELAARFERDAVPLIAAFYPQAMKLTRNRTEAEDLLQETAAKAFAGFHGFRDGTNLGGWLYPSCSTRTSAATASNNDGPRSG